uniref:Uncharacterized protein n=1 Tax=Utricularia reniformis TaxID=192314 RepID=A0A1Y0B4P8_9LAMI|nr:hypothetical protein AEK19_MT2291 [Utricularia reniformis]ART32436.1 hypothetical protein AEK19_MT2291 [Utricularia reniformis]
MKISQSDNEEKARVTGPSWVLAKHERIGPSVFTACFPPLTQAVRRFLFSPRFELVIGHFQKRKT